ncbi:DUF924 domain-containing protein [Motiliproteus coralliicola]|uniref:DUF924 domain-containing protein n=2 Tax=Motiliproteus coralliicola TaxID=2283196 RepID=A0A369WW68_9GAMM|nr:DUF924 domain-containing protein [Motiliproteus coralliicola]
MDWQQIIEFWFEEIEPSKHWIKDAEFDQLIDNRFGDVHAAAAQGELYRWRQEPRGRLAEIIVLDQFSRNIYRDQAAAFGCDAQALVLAQEAVAVGDDQQLEPTQRTFLYMPFMHSESALIHQQAVELFQQPGLEDNYSFELKHKEIIDRFGRYPHRNAILGRESSAEELEFLTQPGSSF